MTNPTTDSAIDNLVRDIMQVPYSKHKAKAAIQQLIDSAVREAEAKLEQAVLAEADDKHNGFGAVVTVDVIKQVFKEMK